MAQASIDLLPIVWWAVRYGGDTVQPCQMHSKQDKGMSVVSPTSRFANGRSNNLRIQRVSNVVFWIVQLKPGWHVNVCNIKFQTQ